MSILELVQQESVALVVYVPDPEIIQKDPLRIEKTIRTLESSVQDEMVPFVENPRELHLSNQHLTPKSQKLREMNLFALEQEFFRLLILAGTHTSDYVREIIYLACFTQIDISVYAEEDSLLMRYLAMQQSGSIRQR